MDNQDSDVELDYEIDEENHEVIDEDEPLSANTDSSGVIPSDLDSFVTGVFLVFVSHISSYY